MRGRADALVSGESRSLLKAARLVRASDGEEAAAAAATDAAATDAAATDAAAASGGGSGAGRASRAGAEAD